MLSGDCVPRGELDLVDEVELLEGLEGEPQALQVARRPHRGGADLGSEEGIQSTSQ